MLEIDSGIYDNDIGAEVRLQFGYFIRRGKSAEQIRNTLFNCLINKEFPFHRLDDDVYNEMFFWMSLADTQWNWGVLLPDVKEHALIAIEKVISIETAKEEKNTFVKRRIRHLTSLKEKLLSPQPIKEIKQIKEPNTRLYKCQWEIGDVFAYKLESDLAKEKGLYGKYFLFQKVDESNWYPGHIIPVVYMKITENETLPINSEEYNSLEYVQTSFSRYEERFCPIDMTRPEEDIAEKSKFNYEVDECGFLPQFRLKLINTSKRIIPSKLIYLGNFTNIVPPPKEFIPHDKINIFAATWKRMESIMIERYCSYNCGESEAYAGRGKR
ncbi:MAG: hypothetical protein IJW79_05660 [Clostridia bacterium]|nr:hypothetical protein [Clostridia bacterium]